MKKLILLVSVIVSLYFIYIYEYNHNDEFTEMMDYMDRGFEEERVDSVQLLKENPMMNKPDWLPAMIDGVPDSEYWDFRLAYNYTLMPEAISLYYLPDSLDANGDSIPFGILEDYGENPPGRIRKQRRFRYGYPDLPN